MRSEKETLVEEISGYLGKSDYCYLTNYCGITVSETSELRQTLSQHSAEFHVVKNRLFKVAIQSRNLPELSSDCLTGPTAVIVGGDDPSAIAKALFAFAQSKEKLEVKGGIVGDRVMTAKEIEQLSKLPSLEILRAHILGLFNTPAQQCVRLLAAVPQGLLNVLQARQP